MSSSQVSPSLSFAAVFGLVFGPANAVVYWISDIYKLPMFSYYPATQRMEWGWTPTTLDDGPAMYWYGWIATSLITSTFIGLFACLLPKPVKAKIPPALSWIVPCLLAPAMIYSLKFYWR